MSLTNLKANYMRMFLKIGAPLEINGVRYNDRQDRVDEQNIFVEKFMNGIRDNMQVKYEEDPTGFRMFIMN